MMTVHLRCGSYLLAPVTIDPSRTNTTASSRFQKVIIGPSKYQTSFIDLHCSRFSLGVEKLPN
jgi:hypothetical protein